MLVGPSKCPSSMSTTTMPETFSVLYNYDYNDPKYIGPFSSLEEAQDYCDSRNSELRRRGIPSWVCSYSVVD